MTDEDNADDERTRAELVDNRAPPAATPVPQGRVADRYTLLRELGRGGMGTVYSAYDEELDRKVAIKLLHHAPSGSLGAPRLLGEAQALARLSHPNVVQVYDVGELGDQVFLAMEYVQGDTLREWQRAAPRTWREVLAVYRQAGEGLAAAHAAGLVHRDIKPDNLMLGQDGRVRVMDFGLARRKSSHRDDVRMPSGRIVFPDEQQPTGSLTGTPAYMSLEQLRGENVGAEADTFALCVSLWEGLHGVRPFSGKSVGELRSQVAYGRILDPPPDRPTPRWLREILLRGFAPDPTQRWPSTAAMLAEIDRGLLRTQRRRTAAGISAVLLALTAIALSVVWWQRTEHRERVAACEALAAEIDGTWNDDARKRLRDALVGSGQSYAADSAARVVPRLDAWTSAWSRVRFSTCSLEHVEKAWSPDLRARADDCLEERRLGFEALLAELLTGDAGAVQGAVDAAASLGDPASCSDPEQLARRPALPDANHERLRELRRALARVAALDLAAKFADGEALARQTLASAEALAWPPAIAEAQLRLGVLEMSRSRHEAAAVQLEAAYFTAMRAQALEIAAEAALQLTQAVGWGMRRRDEGLRWSRHAELVLLALGTGGRTALDVDLLNLRGLVYQAAGENRESVKDFRAALALAETVYGPEHPRLATFLNNIAIDLGQLGELEAAREAAARGLAQVERILGPEHPEIMGKARTLAMRTMTAARLIADPIVADREYARSEALFERAAAIARHAHGPESREYANQLHPLATLRFLRGETEGVEALFREALAITTKNNPDDQALPYILHRLALAQDAFGDPTAARATAEQAVAACRRTVPKDHPESAPPLNTLGLILLHLGDPKAARPLLEEAYAIRQRARVAPLPLVDSLRALALLEVQSGDLQRAREYLQLAAADAAAGELAEPRFALAQASWDREPDARPAALALAEEARAGFAQIGKRGDRQRLAVEAWLAAHR